MSVSSKAYNIVSKDNMKQHEWLNPRLYYLKKLVKPLPSLCPECKNELEYDEAHAQTYCTKCGLVIQEPIQYVSITHVTYPYE